MGTSRDVLGMLRGCRCSMTQGLGQGEKERMNISLLPLGKLPPGRAVSPSCAGRYLQRIRLARRALGQGLCGGDGERQQEAQGWPTEHAGHGTGSADVWTEAGEKGPQRRAGVR